MNYKYFLPAHRASLQTAKSRYRALCLKYHPDKKGGSKEAFDAVQKEYAQLQHDLQQPPQQKATQQPFVFNGKKYANEDAFAKEIARFFVKLLKDGL